MITEHDVSACIERLVTLCSIPSPSGFTEKIESHLANELTKLRFDPISTRKGSMVCDLGGAGRGLVLAAHVDTLGAMVRSLKENGRVRYTQIGGYPEIYITTETCLLHTRDGRIYSGTVQPINPAVHVNRKIRDLKPSDETLEIVLDLIAETKDDLSDLGVSPGDYVSFDPRTRVTESGYIKSRHLDDKASAATLLSLASLVSEKRLDLSRKVYLLFTTYEEVGHGGASGIPDGIEEMISVDMGAVGDDLQANERTVSICAKDSGGPYDYNVTGALIEAAKRSEAHYAVDIYPQYGSDVEATLRAGHDITHGLIGPGVSASHGYERTHRDGLESTLKLLAAYVSSV